MIPMSRLIILASIAGCSLVCPSSAAAPPAAKAHAAKQERPEKKAPVETMGYQSLAMQGGESCVVNERYAKGCLLTTDDYNKQVYTLEMVTSGAFLQAPGRNRVDSTRHLALKSVLFNVFKEQKLRAAGLELTLDSVSAEACKEIALRSDTALARRLRQYYNAHYATTFKARRVPVFEIIAGTDSAHIRSIFEFLEKQDSLLSAIPPADSAARRKAVARINSLPWRRAVLDDLGPAAAKAASTLKHSQWSLPVRTAYGFAILSLVDSVWTQEIFLPTIQDSLHLVLKGQEGEFLSQAKSYYRSNRRSFPMPDTLHFKLAICPDSSCIRKQDRRKALPIMASEHMMPPSTRTVLKSAYHSRVPDSVWFETPLGLARMAVAKASRGRGSRPFDEVKMEIFKRIDVLDESSLLESVQCVQIRRRIANQMVPYLYQDVATLLRNNNLQPGQKTRDKELHGAMKDTWSRFRGEFESWMKGLAINVPEF
jgi:hypothetical protein